VATAARSPVPATELKAKLDKYTEARAATVAAETETREQHAIKDEALDDLVDGMKADLKYAEIAVRDRPEKLSKLGWAGPRSSSRLEAPGEVRNIGIVAEGDTWAILRWKPPVEGVRAGFYKIQRQSEDSAWEDAGTSTKIEQLMSDQPRGVEIHFRVIAVNLCTLPCLPQAGAGRPACVSEQAVPGRAETAVLSRRAGGGR